MKKYVKNDRFKLSKSDLLTLFSLGLALFVIVLDGTIMNVSMKAIMQELHVNPSSMQMLITAYSLVLAAFTLIGARLGDILGRKNMFLFGAFLFALGAILAAISTNALTLFLGWSIIEGLGASLMMPATVSLLTESFYGPKRALGFGVWGAIASIGASLGPLIGGYVTTNYSWRLAFWLEFIPILLVFVFAKYVRDKKDYLKPIRSFDLLGSIFSATGFSLFVYGTLKAQTYGWFCPKSQEYSILGLSKSFIYIILGVISLIIFVFVEARCAKKKKHCIPLVELSLFKSRQFNIGLLITVFQSIAQSGFIFILPMYLLIVKNLNAVQTGIAMLPITISVMIASVLGSRIRNKEKILIFSGFWISALSVFWMYRILDVTTSIKALIYPFGLFGLGLGLIASQLTNVTISAHPNEKAGEASGINSTFRRVGSTLGTSIMGSILFSKFAMYISTNLASKGMTTISKSFAFNSGSSDITSLLNNHHIPKVIINIILNSFVDASKYTLLISVVALLLVSFLVFLFPKRIKISK